MSKYFGQPHQHKGTIQMIPEPLTMCWNASSTSHPLEFPVSLSSTGQSEVWSLSSTSMNTNDDSFLSCKWVSFKTLRTGKKHTLTSSTNQGKTYVCFDLDMDKQPKWPKLRTTHNYFSHTLYCHMISISRMDLIHSPKK